MSSVSDKKVDMSSDAIAAYYRKLNGPRKDLPSAPSLGIPRNAETATNVARLATKKEPVQAMPRPGSSTDAARASILANASTSRLTSASSASSLSSAAANKSLYHTNYNPPEQPINALAASAATKVISTSGEEHARKYLPHGYGWTDRNGRTDSLSSVDMSKVNLTKLTGAAQERAKARLAQVHIVNHREDPESAAQRQYDIKNQITVYQLAQERVKQALNDVDRKNADRSIYGTHEDRRRAYEIASSASAARTSITGGKRDIGGGLYMNDDEILAIARRAVEPDLDQISKFVADRHEKDRLDAEAKAAAEQARAEEKERQKKSKEDQKAEAAASKAKAKEESDKLKEQQQKEKEVEDARKAVEKRQEEERNHIATLKKKAKKAERDLAAIKAGDIPEGETSATSPTVESAKAKAEAAKAELAEAEAQATAAKAKEEKIRDKKERIIEKHRQLKEKYHTQRGEEQEQHNKYLEEWRVDAKKRAIEKAEKRHNTKKEEHERKQALALAEYRMKKTQQQLWPKKSSRSFKGAVAAESYKDVPAEGTSKVANAAGGVAAAAAAVIPGTSATEAKETAKETVHAAKAEKLAKKEAKKSKATEEVPEGAVAGAKIEEPETTGAEAAETTAAEATEPAAEPVAAAEVAEPETAVKDIADEPLDVVEKEEGDEAAAVAAPAEEAGEEAAKEADDSANALEPVDSPNAPKIEPYKEFKPDKVRIKEAEPPFTNSESLEELKNRVKAYKAKRQLAEEKHEVAIKDLELANSKLAAVTSEYESLVATEAELRSREESHQRAVKTAAEREANQRQEALLKARLESTTLTDLEKAEVEAEYAELKKKQLDFELHELKVQAKQAKREAAENEERAKNAAAAVEAARAKEEEQKKAEAEAKAAAKKAKVEKKAARKREKEAAAAAAAAGAGATGAAGVAAEDTLGDASNEASVEPEAGGLKAKALPVSSESTEPTEPTEGVTDRATTKGEPVDLSGDAQGVPESVIEEAAEAGEKKQEYDEVAEQAAALGEKKEEYNEAAEQAAEEAAALEPKSVTEKVDEPLGEPDAEETDRLNAEAEKISKKAEDATKSTEFENFDSSNEKPKHGMFSEGI